MQRPYAVVVHGQCVHAATCRHGPDLDCLVGRASQDGVAVVREKDVAYVVGVSDKLGDALA